MAAALVFGVLAGMVLALSFWLFADHAAIRTLRKRLWSHVLALRLFGDEPAVAFGTLLGTFKTNALLLGHALPPLAIAAPVLALAAFHLSDFFARTPLETGSDAVLTVKLRSPAEPLPMVVLQTPSWVEVDSPPVRIASEGEISWRLRANEPKLGICYISLQGETVGKELDARPGPRYSGTVRARSWTDALLHPAESRLPDGPVERIWISQGPSPLTCAGVTMDWWEWIAAIASIAAWVFSLLLARMRGPRLLHLLFHRL